MKNYITPNFKFADMIPIKAQGNTVWDENNKDYIDLLGGIAVNALGHCHPELIKTLHEQADKLWHISNTFTTTTSQALAERLVKNTFAEKVFFANSGAEVNEAALKLARKYAYDHFGPKKNKIISCYNSFHGRTLFTATVGGQEKYQTGFGPLPPAIYYTEFNNTEALKDILDDETCAFIVEPIQGESGVLPAHLEFLKTARELCNKHEIALILDEIQTGMGRTGSLFAYQQYQITPDILTSAKALGCGLPIGAMLTTDQFAEAFTPGSHGTTFGGNPLVCAVANTAFDIINSEETLSNVKKQHEYFESELNQIAAETGKFKLIRGKGLLIGCVLADEFEGKANQVVSEALKAGVIVNQAGPNVVRLAPSLIINDEDRQKGLNRLKRALDQWIPQ
ncbi:acetylornithine/succinylornithine family transaminase [Neisseriaceae bacterium PsAf]|nr:acetylornithine/succinylornithine family transaminase [Neisseriaceae bacterium PsAf]